MRLALCSLALVLLVAPLNADPYPTDRDRILSEADTFYNLEWYCSANNIYVAGSPGYVDSRCEYTVPGSYTNMAYKWGGYDTVDGFLSDMAIGRGAGDTDSSGVNSNCSGVDCSGYVSRLWECGRFATASFYRASFDIDQEDLRMGDAVNKAGSHIRLFVRWEDSTHIWVYESTTGVDPGRVTLRSLSYTPSSSYVPIRYDRDDDSTSFVRIDPEPTIQWVTRSGAQSAWIPFDGEADSGYRLEHSTDGVAWTTLQTESTLGSGAFRADVAGLALDTDHLFRVVAVNSGGPTAPSDTLALRLDGLGDPRILLVDGMDRWRTEGGGNPGHTFLVSVAQSLGRLGHPFESCSNEMVAVGMVDLQGYDAVIWLVGEDSTDDESISRGEQFHIRRYLEQGGQLFLSGSEIAWDLDHQGSSTRFQDPTDGPFMTDCLRIGYDSDGSSGNGYQASGIAGTPCEGLSLNFDDGTHGTYDVTYPDSFTLGAGAEAWLTYASHGENALVAFEGTFGSSTATGRVVVLGIPLETIHVDAERDALLTAVMGFFGFAAAGTPEIAPIADDAVRLPSAYAGPTPALLDGDGVITWTLEEGPSGMTIDSGTGVVSWLSPAVGGDPHAVTIRATNSLGHDEESWRLTVIPEEPGVIWEDDFDMDSSGDYTVIIDDEYNTPLTQPGDGEVNFSHDHSGYVGSDPAATVIPPAPRTPGISTRSLKIRVNIADETTGDEWVGVNIFPHLTLPNGLNWTMEFDAFLMYNGDAGGGIGSTEFLQAGVNHSAEAPAWPLSTVDTSDGIFVMTSSDGGSSRDYRLYTGGGVGAAFFRREDTEGFHVLGDANAAPGTGAPYDVYFPSPPYETPGVPGKRWVLGRLSVIDNTLTYSLDGHPIIVFPNDSAFTSGAPMLGCSDIFNSVAEPATDNFVLFDNLRIATLPDSGLAAPAVESIPDQSATEGSAHTGPTPAVTVGTDPITWILMEGPSGMSVDSATGVVAWPNPTVVASPASVTVRATNAVGCDDVSWQVTVEPPLSDLVLDHLLSESAYSSECDTNEDGVVDAADLVNAID
jgi:Putative Ig domain